jgi:hypothetical protein
VRSTSDSLMRYVRAGAALQRQPRARMGRAVSDDPGHPRTSHGAGCEVKYAWLTDPDGNMLTLQEMAWRTGDAF